jgi:hypothetical protein
MPVLMTYGIPSFQGTAQTVGAQSKTIVSYPISQNSVVNLMVYFTAVNSAFSLAKTGYLVGTALRATGNVILQSVPIIDAVGSLTSTIGLAANTGTQNIDVNITGVLVTTINWHCVGYPMVIS